MADSVGDRPPTIRTVAARAGVSKSLVSLVLQNSPRVSDEKRQAVLKAVAELGYRPDPVARSLAERRTRTIGVVIDDLSNPWYVELLDGLRPVLHEHGLRPLLADGRTEPDAVQALSDLRVDGLVLVGTPTTVGRRPGQRFGKPDTDRRRRHPRTARYRLSTSSPTTTTAAANSRRRICWSWAIDGSPTSSGRAKSADSGARATT